MSECTPDELISKLSDANRDEDSRFEDINEAFDWLRAELNELKEQDKTLMKKFTHIREQLNKLNDETAAHKDRVRSLSDINRTHDDGFNEAKRCNLDPFDVDPDDTSALRRRAFSSSALHKTVIKTATFAEVY